MANSPKYYIVEASALPEVFIKVAEAKRLLSTGKAATVNDATQMTGISRSAFYKYRDAIMPFQDMRSSRIITFQILLHDEPGSLNKLLTILADHQANIMTINSTVPSNGSGVVTIAAETANLEVPLEDLLEAFRQVPGVIKADILAG
ncbi:MAG: ACT domain-containing protein [Oscillospiraceae bacterium]|nr:ACT domain-containing protein [Oscillospiraceae bacterium]